MNFSLQTSRFPPIILYTQATNTRIITNDFGTVTAPIGITQKNGQLLSHAKSSLLVVYDQKTGLGCSPTGVKKNKKNDTMTKLSLKQEVIGTRTGYVIRFTCPSCLHDNAIVNKTPKECYRETRDATCHQCKLRSTVLTPGMYEKKVYSPV